MNSWDPLVVEQDRFWVDRQGRVHRLAEMSWEHRAAVLGLLESSAQYVWIVYHEVTLARLVEVVLLEQGIPGDLLARDLGVIGSHEMAPRTWLESTPLVRALRRSVLPTRSGGVGR
jgi:hypothetical protein